MLALPLQLRALFLCALLSPAHAVPPRHLFRRDDTCADKKLASCPSEVPENFCCPDETKCIVLAGGTTALCCPEGKTCDRISPITCNLALQDADRIPNAGVKTTALDGELGKCGSGCCPFGYSCDDDKCIMDDDQSEAPARGSGRKPTPSPSDTTGSTKPTISDEGSTKEPQGDKDAVPTTAIVVGVLLGVLGLVAAIVFILIWRSKRRRKPANTDPTKLTKSRSSQSLASSSFGNSGDIPNAPRTISNISKPIVDEGQIQRNDFGRRSESTRKPPNRSGSSRRVADITREGPSDASWSGGAVAPIRGMNTSSRVSSVSGRSGRGSRASDVSALSDTLTPLWARDELDRRIGVSNVEEESERTVDTRRDTTITQLLTETSRAYAPHSERHGPQHHPHALGISANPPRL